MLMDVFCVPIMLFYFAKFMFYELPRDLILIALGK